MSTSVPDDRSSAVYRQVRARFSERLALLQALAGQGGVEASNAGSYVTLLDGRRLLDFGSYAVHLLGHRNAAVVDFVIDQLGRMSTSTRIIANEVAPLLADELSHRLGPGLGRTYFGLNGSDVVDLALKLALWRRPQGVVLAVEGAFHGKTLATSALSAGTAIGPAGALPGFVVRQLRREDPGAVEAALRPGDLPAALVFEPIQGEGGVHELDPVVVRRWSDDVHSRGGLVITDEIQCGLHRCGPFSLARAMGIEPDVVLLGKSLGGGVLPISAAVGTDQAFTPLLEDPFWHSATFSGHPLCCAAALGALAELDRLVERTAHVGDLVGRRLDDLRSRHPTIVREVRGRGFLRGIELARPEMAGDVLVECFDRGLLLSPCLTQPETIRLLPPLVASEAEVDVAVEILDAAMSATAVSGVRAMADLDSHPDPAPGRGAL